ncbi:epsin-1 isoform X2 [Oreochromis niloticus]|uniref:Epsin 1a n=2 Tax=Oreochromis TaxID=8139 RepID=A0A669C239_ORENI|nr:epsin-1 isoform X2 [Oreochromis niloticus]XP_005455457.1 epsin-1 isoform X2 [Oreochromis niloticus]XP_013130069.1 epsin-1 isoform X2 [Oreochromis niloticus]XP_013130070.1 epsin-1 isoform X2 [Oreochromis niloticus]XP_019219983.1 epsin-1 isoform X2 [Oreochromis niloticus]XP_019219984.1 epsin-1 isoform X2 [Oreochromis niloticus]XP_019219985.1 epsin-1 isoform X2 [Oreochromis niloticus]XP_019219986.1 epsin-1 isoform X2 [Oreochromis niloticus]XP_025767266.1 epsin-1 isoform X2 [Oreochromis nilo
MSTSSLRRQVKNIVHNYSEAEIKVREATSNDPWGPSSSLMSEIADLTYNVVAFSEIMSMVWKRLNDHGKNWRHVYKAMTLMEYLIKTGSERVAQQCRENIYAVQTLKDFQYIDRDGKDQGVNVREKAKQLVTLLKDEERLREERIHALKTKEKMAQTSSASSAPSAPSLGGSLSLGSHSGGADSEQAWPQSSGEEDLQLQLALAMSKEEAEQNSTDPLEDAELRYALTLSKEIHQQEERLRRGDDLRLQMAIEESKREKPKPEESALMELSAVDPWGTPAAPVVSSAGPSPLPTVSASAASGPWGTATTDPWGVASPTSPTSSDPWGGGAPPTIAAPPDPWGESSNKVNNVDPWGSSAVTPPSADPWGPPLPPSTSSSGGPVDPWAKDGPVPASDPITSDIWSGSAKHTNGTGDPEQLGSSGAGADSTGSPVPFDLSSLGSSLPVRKTPESFLGPNAALVDLDSLVPSKPKPKQPPPPSISSSSAHNPFLQNTGSSPATGMAVTPGSTISSRGVSPTPASSNPFGVAPPMTSISPQPSSLGLSGLRTSPVPPNPMLGMVQPGMGMAPMSMGMGAPGMGMGLGMMQPSPMGMPYSGLSPMAPPGSGLMGPGVAPPPQLILGGPTGPGGVMSAGGSVGGGGTTGTSTNPFLL